MNAATAQKKRPLLVMLHEAMRWATEQRIPVAPDGFGVVCVDTKKKVWQRAPEKTVDPLGALILREQPATVDVHEAAGMVLDCGPVFVGGVEDGLARRAGEADVPKALRERYLAGIELGIWLRCELVGKACPLHGHFNPAETVCPVCTELE